MASTVRKIEDVLDAELREIRIRRGLWEVHARECEGDTAGEPRPASLEKLPEDSRPDNLVGLALSGGGVRSAAFSLGLLQALKKKKRFRDIDYLSTVSGGGYAGGLFSGSVAGDRKSARVNPLAIEPCADGSQPARVYELALHGRLFSRPLHWLSRHLWGWLVTLTFVVSGVTAIASLLAWLMRIVWSHHNLIVVSALGFSTDLHIAFYPAFLALLVWAFCSLLSVVLEAMSVRTPPISRYAYVLLITTLVLSLVSFVAIGDFDMADYVSAGKVPAWAANTVTWFLQLLGQISLALLSLFLLPLLVPRRLLESGRNRQNPLFMFAFNTAGFALICGVPLAVFFFLTKENVSGYNLNRPDSDMLTSNHIEELEKFIPEVKDETPGSNPYVPKLRCQVAGAIDKAITDSGQGGLYPKLRQDVVNDQEDAWIVTRLLQYVALWLVRDQSFQDVVQRREEQIKSEAMIAKHVNRAVLTNPYLFEPDLQAAIAAIEKKEQLVRTWREEQIKSEAMIAKHVNRAVLTNPYLFEIIVELAFAAMDKEEQPAVTMDEILRQLGLEKLKEPQKDEVSAAIRSIWPVKSELKQLYKTMYENISGERNRGYWKRSMLDALLQYYPHDPPGPGKKNPGYERLTEKQKEEEDSKNIQKKSVPDLKTLRIILAASVVDDVSDDVIRKGSSNPPENPNAEDTQKTVLIARRFSQLQALLQMDSVDLLDKLDDKLELVFSEERRKKEEFVVTLKKLLEEEREIVASHLETLRTSNWTVLSAMYSKNIRPRQTIFAWTVNEADQRLRLQILGYSALLFLFVGLVANLNSMSLHSVYRDELAGMWLSKGPEWLKDLDTCRNGYPLHLFSTTLNRHGKKSDPVAEDTSLFVLSNLFCGSREFGYRETGDFENGKLRVADAVAISGAAVSASYAGDLLFKTLLFLTNLRLGQWLRNPKRFEQEYHWPAPLRILLSMVLHPTDRAFVDLTDGGHFDNTGLSALLERRCRVIILADCSEDPKYLFADLFSVLQIARARHGIKIEETNIAERICKSDVLVPDSEVWFKYLIPDESKLFLSRSHFVALRLTYPEREEKHPWSENSSGEMAPDHVPENHAVLILIKPTLTGDEPPDLLARRRMNEGFPNDITINQFLDPNQFESYVMLGRHIGDELDAWIEGKGEGGLGRIDLSTPACSSEKQQPPG